MRCDENITCYDCYEGYAFKNETCVQCGVNCSRCDKQLNCLECSGSNRDLLNDCQCEMGYYLNETMSLNDCIQCPPECIDCMSENECLVCAESYYLDFGVCIECDIKCFNCTDGLSCTSCLDENADPPDCVCKDLYQISNYTGFCEKCGKKCQTCSDPDIDDCDTCLEFSHRDSPPQCECRPGYYDDNGQHPWCKKCPLNCLECSNPSNCFACNTSGFELLLDNPPFCSCPETLYLNLSTNKCELCAEKCLTCVNLTHCIECQGENRSSLAPFCPCLGGYQDEDGFYQDCTPCEQPYCDLCTNSSICLQCATDLREGPSCQCIGGYFDELLSNGSDFLLYPSGCGYCFPGCLHCPDEIECYECYPDRNLPDCNCQLGKFEYPEDPITCYDCPPLCRSCLNFTECETCYPNTNRIPPDCDCEDGYYETFNATSQQMECWPCDLQCDLCLTSSTQCLKCISDPHRTPEPACLCQQGYFQFEAQLLCEQCHYRCVSCTESPKCVTCKQPSLRILPLCECIDEYYEDFNLTKNCLPCHYRCKTCDNYDSCLTCNPHRNSTNDCLCELGYYQNSNEKSCRECFFACLGCSSYQVCQGCKGLFRNSLSVKCDCLKGYYDLGTLQDCRVCSYQCAACTDFTVCTECKGAFRNSNPPTCDCQERYYDNGQSSNCQECLYYCQTCVNGSSCLTCRGSQRIDDPQQQCPCSRGYYDDGQDHNCVICRYNCESCLNGVSCQTCQGENRAGIPQCECSKGFYDLSTILDCLQCPKYCSACISDTNCTECNGNFRNTSRICECNDDYYQSLYDEQCYFCDAQCKLPFWVERGYFLEEAFGQISLKVRFTQRVYEGRNYSEYFIVRFQTLSYPADYTYRVLQNIVTNSSHSQSQAQQDFYIEIETKKSIYKDRLTIYLKKDNTFISVYTQDLEYAQNATFLMFQGEEVQEVLSFMIGPILVGQDSSNLIRFYRQMEKQSENLQGQENTVLKAVKMFQFLLFFINPQAVTNLMFLDCGFPPHSYEFLRLVASSIYQKIPSWSTKQYADLLAEPYTYPKMFFDLSLDEALYPDQIPSGIYKLMSFTANFFVNSFQNIFLWVCVWVMFGIFHLIIRCKMKSEEDVDIVNESKWRSLHDFWFNQVIKVHEIVLNVILMNFYLQLKQMNLRTPLNVASIVIGFAFILEYLFFYRFCFRSINATTDRIPEIQLKIEQFTPLIEDLKYNLNLQLFDNHINPYHYLDTFYSKLRVNYHFYGMLKKVLIITIIVFLDKYPNIQIMALLSIHCFVGFLTLVLTPYLTAFQNFIKFSQDSVLILIHVYIYLIKQKQDSLVNAGDLTIESIEEYFSLGFSFIYQIYTFISLQVIMLLFTLGYNIYKMKKRKDEYNLAHQQQELLEQQENENIRDNINKIFKQSQIFSEQSTTNLAGSLMLLGEGNPIKKLINLQQHQQSQQQQQLLEKSKPLNVELQQLKKSKNNQFEQQKLIESPFKPQQQLKPFQQLKQMKKAQNNDKKTDENSMIPGLYENHDDELTLQHKRNIEFLNHLNNLILRPSQININYYNQVFEEKSEKKIETRGDLELIISYLSLASFNSMLILNSMVDYSKMLIYRSMESKKHLIIENKKSNDFQIYKTETNQIVFKMQHIIWDVIHQTIYIQELQLNIIHMNGHKKPIEVFLYNRDKSYQDISDMQNPKPENSTKFIKYLYETKKINAAQTDARHYKQQFLDFFTNKLQKTPKQIKNILLNIKYPHLLQTSTVNMSQIQENMLNQYENFQNQIPIYKNQQSIKTKIFIPETLKNHL